jgi:DNA polymerase
MGARKARARQREAFFRKDHRLHKNYRDEFSLYPNICTVVNPMRKRVEKTAAPLIPPEPTIPKLREAAMTCRACELWKRGTQTVFGEGRSQARVMLVGEQPGDQEDIQGRPFVGPAGKILDKALEEAGINRDEVYVTNAVKHFKWEPRGKRRIHKKPNSMEITACKPWIEAEIDVIKPDVIVCLGATAAQALLGREFRVSTQRGTWVSSPLAPFVMATVHPSSLLRAPDEVTRRLETKRFIQDLKLVREALEKEAA